MSEVPAWAAPVVGTNESALRILDAIVSRSTAGETVESLVDDYEDDGVTVEFVERVLERWTPEPWE